MWRSFLAMRGGMYPVLVVPQRFMVGCKKPLEIAEGSWKCLVKYHAIMQNCVRFMFNKNLKPWNTPDTLAVGWSWHLSLQDYQLASEPMRSYRPMKATPGIFLRPWMQQSDA